MDSQNNPNYITYGQMNIIQDFRKLWTEFSFWMKIYIMSLDDNSNDITEVSERLYRVPQDFYYKIEVFFGAAMAEQFSSYKNSLNELVPSV